MKQAFGLWQSSVGKKVTMAISGIMLLGFVVAHLLGNFKVFSGQAEYDAYAEFLRDEEIQAVVVAVPDALHIPRAMEALQAGKHVLIEKSMGVNSDECRDLVRCAESVGR